MPDQRQRKENGIEVGDDVEDSGHERHRNSIRVSLVTMPGQGFIVGLLQRVACEERAKENDQIEGHDRENAKISKILHLPARGENSSEEEEKDQLDDCHHWQIQYLNDEQKLNHQNSQ